MSSVMWTHFEPDAPSGWAEDGFAAFIEPHRWIFARTMPDQPHEYTLRRESSEAEFVAAVRYIREHGAMEDYRGRPYKVLHHGGQRFWTMGAAIDKTILINRAQARLPR